MCVIVISKSGKKLSEEILQKCWDKNEDGAGIAVINDDKNTSVSKGYKTYEDFLKGYNAIPEGKRHVIHFRFVSKGADNDVMTHPFVLDSKLYKVDNKPKDSYNIEFADIEQVKRDGIIQFNTNEYSLFHNGTVSNFGDDDNSDTFYLSYMLSHIEDAGKFAILQNLSDVNKFCMVGKGNIWFWGEFLKDETAGEDFLFSNLSWKITRVVTYSNYNVGNYNTYWWDKEKKHIEIKKRLKNKKTDIEPEVLSLTDEKIADIQPIGSLCSVHQYNVGGELFCYKCPHEIDCIEYNPFDKDDYQGE
jgi:hypothetical protein